MGELIITGSGQSFGYNTPYTWYWKVERADGDPSWEDVAMYQTDYHDPDWPADWAFRTDYWIAVNATDRLFFSTDGENWTEITGVDYVTYDGNSYEIKIQGTNLAFGSFAPALDTNCKLKHFNPLAPDQSTINSELGGMLNGYAAEIMTAEEYRKYLEGVKCCNWTLYMDSNTYYLTWDSPYIEDSAGENNVYPHDVTVEIHAEFNHIGPGPDPGKDIELDYSNEPYTFTYRGLMADIMPNSFVRWLQKAMDAISYMDSGDLELYARLSWKETDEHGSTTEQHTDPVSVVFDPRWIVGQFFTHTSESIKTYTPVVADGSTLTLKDGLPNDDPDFHTAEWNGLEYTTDDDYEDPSESEDTWTEPGDYYTNNTLTKTYAMTSARLDSLGNFLWGGSFASMILSVNSSPIENIVGLYAFPFDLSGTDEEIYLGNVPCGVNGAKISNTYNPTVSVGTVDVGGIYESFLDLEPYTRLYIFLPFIGLKQLDISRCHGRSLSLEYVPDLVTGITSANIYIDGKLEYVFSCQMGIQIPLNATNAGQVAGSVLSNLASTAVLAAANIAAENYIGAVGVIAGGGVAAATAKVTTETSGAHSANCWSKMPRTAFLLYDRPVYQNLAMFNHTYGRMCNLSKQLGSLKGFTQVSNIDLSGIQIATKQEADEIRDLLREGVWL